MRTNYSITTIGFALGFIGQAFLMPCLAFARHEGDANFASIRQQFEPEPVPSESENRTPAGIPILRIVGNLMCDMGDVNTGQSCTLKILEARTGKTYRLVKADEALKLYRSGVKNVAIDGTLADTDLIAVTKAVPR